MRTRARCRMTRHWTTLLLRSCGNRGGRLFAESCRTSGCFASLAGIEWAARSTAVYRTGILQKSAAIPTAGGCRSTTCYQMIPSNCCRLVEDADLRAAQELFGSSGDMQQQKLKTLREHENYGRVTRL